MEATAVTPEEENSMRDWLAQFCHDLMLRVEKVEKLHEEHVKTHVDWQHAIEAQLKNMADVVLVDTEERPSLKTLIGKMDAHITAMCTWANVIRRCFRVIGAVASLSVALLASAHYLGYL
jgi:hypothetical protein